MIDERLQFDGGEARMSGKAIKQCRDSDPGSGYLAGPRAAGKRNGIQ